MFAFPDVSLTLFSAITNSILPLCLLKISFSKFSGNSKLDNVNVYPENSNSSSLIYIRICTPYLNSTKFHPDMNYMKLNGYSKNGITLRSDNNIEFNVSSGSGLDAGYLGTDPLNIIGYNKAGKIKVSFNDTKYKPASIQYCDIYVNLNAGSDFFSGYIVNDGNESYIKDSAAVSRPFPVSEEE